MGVNIQGFMNRILVVLVSSKRKVYKLLQLLVASTPALCFNKLSSVDEIILTTESTTTEATSSEE